MILEKDLMVSASIIGADCKLSPLGSFLVIQDAITEMMGLNKVDGVTIKREYNAFWVFTKTHVQFYKPIVWGNDIHIKCYISELTLARLKVDVVITDASGALALRSQTEICALDVDTKRIRKTSTVGVDKSMVYIGELEAFPFIEIESIAGPVIDSIKVRSTNIDFSHHTNNTEYIRLIMNTYSVEEYENAPVKEMEVRYVGQSYENDVLNIRKATANNADYITIEKDDKPIILCKMILRS